jgi:hypothetical protein
LHAFDGYSSKLTHAAYVVSFLLISNTSHPSDEVRQILETALRSLEEIGEVQLPRALEEFVSMVVPRRLSSDGAKGAPASARPSALPDPVAITARP